MAKVSANSDSEVSTPKLAESETSSILSSSSNESSSVFFCSILS